ncbi:hypothetical protein Unana1_05791 [Umbelopsis nana]
MASPLPSKDINAPSRPDITNSQHASNVHSPGSWQYQLTESMLMHNNRTGQDMATTSLHSKEDPRLSNERQSEERYMDEEKTEIPHPQVEVVPPAEAAPDVQDITTPQRFGYYIDKRFAPIGSEDGRPRKPMRAFSDYMEDEEPQAPAVPHGSLLFLFGFICPPSWWIGALYPLACFRAQQPKIPKIERRWRSANRVMTALSILLIAALLGIMGWYISKSKTSSS